MPMQSAANWQAFFTDFAAHCTVTGDCMWPRAIAIGIGEGGVSAINHRVALGIAGVNCITVHTDQHSLLHSHAARKLTLDSSALGKTGLDAGRRIAQDNIDSIYSALDRNDMVFIIPDMRDATAVGIASVIARIAKRRLQVTLGIAIRPFSFENEQNRKTARANEKAFALYVDCLIVIPGKLLTKRRKAQAESGALYDKANELCRVAVNGLSNGIGKGLYDGVAGSNSIQATCYEYRGLLGAKTTLIGVGAASGEDRAAIAWLRAINNPFLDGKWEDMHSLNKILINITVGAGSCLSNRDVSETIGLVRKYVHNGAYIVFVVSTEDALEEEFRIALLADEFTGR